MEVIEVGDIIVHRDIEYLVSDIVYDDGDLSIIWGDGTFNTYYEAMERVHQENIWKLVKKNKLSHKF